MEQAKAAAEQVRIDTDRQITVAKQNLEQATRAIETAESYKQSYGSTIEWGGETYNLGSTSGWRAYQRAVREAKSEVNRAENELKRYETRVWTARTEKKARETIAKAEKVKEKANLIIKKQEKERKKLSKAERELKAAVAGEPPREIGVISAVGAIYEDVKDAGVQADKPSTYIAYSKDAIRGPYERTLRGMQAIGELMLKEAERDERPRFHADIEDIKDYVETAKPSTYTVASRDVLSHMGYAVSQMTLGITEEATFPFSVGVAPPKRPQDIGFRVVGGLLMPTLVDYAATKLIRKLALRKNGAKLIDEFFIKEVPLETRLGTKVSIFELMDAERVLGSAATNTHRLRIMLKTVDLRGLTRFKGKISDDVFGDLIQWEKMQGTQKLTTYELRKLRKALDTASEQLTGARYYQEARQYEKLGKVVQDTIASGEPSELAKELKEIEKLMGRGRLSISDLRKGVRRLGKNADEVLENASKLDDAMNGLKGAEDWGGGVDITPSKADQERMVETVTTQLAELRKALNKLVDIDPDSGMWTRYGLLGPDEKKRLLDRYRKLVELWEERPDLFTAGASYQPSNIADLESYLEAMGWEPDDFVNFLAQNADSIPVGVLTQFLNKLGENVKKAKPSEITDARTRLDQLPMPFDAEEGLPKDLTTQVPMPIETTKEEAENAEEQKVRADEAERQALIVTPITDTPEEPPPPEEADEEEPGEGEGQEQPDEGEEEAKGGPGADRLGGRGKFRVKFSFPDGSSQSLSVEASSYPEALNRAQRLRRSSREPPFAADIWRLE